MKLALEILAMIAFSALIAVTIAIGITCVEWVINSIKVKVNNVPHTVEKFIVARFVANELWYWGSWDNADEAHRIAEELENGIVVERI